MNFRGIFSTEGSIKEKIGRTILIISLVSVMFVSICSAVIIFTIKANLDNSLKGLSDTAASDSTGALRTQIQKELFSLAENKRDLADARLKLIQNQTQSVAMAAADLFEGEGVYLPPLPDYRTLPIDAIDFAGKGSKFGAYSIHMRAPKKILNEDSIVMEDGVIVRAELDRNRLIDVGASTEKEKYRMIRELYLAKYLSGALGGIRNFDNGDGTYDGIAASYFCFDSSGIDILADLNTMPMVAYDGREKEWFQEAKKLNRGEIYWTNPIADASGRGISLICSMPVYANDQFIGVAGSGGLMDNIRELVESTTIGENGYAFLVNKNETGNLTLIASADGKDTSEVKQVSDHLQGTDNLQLAEVLDQAEKGKSGIDQITLDGESVFIAYSSLETVDWIMFTVIGVNDSTLVKPIHKLENRLGEVTEKYMGEVDIAIAVSATILVFLIGLAILLAMAMAKKHAAQLTAPILELTEGVRTVSGGNLDFQIFIDTGDEISELGNAFNHMTENIKDYIKNLSKVTAEKERIGAELNVATQIQASMLPCIFPAFPDKTDQFAVYATMTPAKEVGGDFYDFFTIDENKIGLVIADVSGKGVPAALFMVIAKTLIKNYAQMGKSTGEILRAANEQLCENNDSMLFVTCFMGTIELTTGVFTYVNAGHNPPLLMRSGADYQWMNLNPGRVLAIMPDTEYVSETIHMNPGDRIYMYTDGVTEAINEREEEFSEEKLIAVLNRLKEASLEETLHGVKEEMDRFCGDAPQFDDITMLSFEYKEKE